MVAALLAQDLRELVAHRFELRAAVVDDAVAALEAEHQRAVDQLEQVAVGLGLLGQPRHQLEDLLAAPGFVVEHGQQAVLRPHAGAAPGRVGSGLVDHRAQHVARRHHALGRDAGTRGLRGEIAHALRQRIAQCGGVGHMPRGPQLRDDQQQPVGQGHQRVQAGVGGRGVRQCVTRRLGPAQGPGAAARVRLDEGARLVELRERVSDAGGIHRARPERSLADRPQLEFQPGELAGHMQREAAAALDLLPQVAAAVELEVVEAGVEG